MEKKKTLFTSALVRVGERIALLLLLLVGSIILFAQETPKAQANNVITDSVIGNNTIIFIPSPTPTPTPTLTPLPTATPTPSPSPVPTIDPNTDSIWDQIAQCESNGHWNDDTGNGYYGGLQFNQGAWNSVGGLGNPAQASREEQIEKAKLLQAKRGWGVWSACAKKLGLD